MIITQTGCSILTITEATLGDITILGMTLGTVGVGITAGEAAGDGT